MEEWIRTRATVGGGTVLVLCELQAAAEDRLRGGPEAVRGPTTTDGHPERDRHRVPATEVLLVADDLLHRQQVATTGRQTRP
jgi:hypothetical protein